MQLKFNKQNLSNKYIHYLILSGIIILTLIIYSGTFINGFTNWDDKINITGNKDIQNLSVSGIAKIFSTYYANTWKPLTMLTFSLIYHFFGLNPAAFHSVNLVFHLLNIVLVYIFIYQLTGPQSTNLLTTNNEQRTTIATFVTLFFAIHPMHSEPVYWISGLDNCLYSFFYLASLIFYLKYLKSTVHSPQSTAKIQNSNQYIQHSTFNIQHLKLYLISLIFFMLSLLSKPMSVTLPIVLFLLDYYCGRKFHSKTIIEKIPFFLLALVLVIITMISEKFTVTTPTNDVLILIQYSLFNRFFLLTYSLSFYIIYLIAPFKLCILHAPPEINQGFLPFKYYISPILIIIITGLILKIKKPGKEMIFGTLFFLFTIVAALTAGKVRYEQLAERHTYIPYLGLFFIIGQYYYRIKKVNPDNIGINIIIIMFILMFSFISYERNKVWENSRSLYKDVIEKYPRGLLPYLYSASAKYDIGDKQGAIEDYNKLIEIDPHDAMPLNDRGLVKDQLGDYRGAIDDYNKAIEIKPQNVEAFTNRGVVKEELGDHRGAINDYNKAIEINPRYAGAYTNRGVSKASLGDMQGAIRDYNNAIELNPKYAEAFFDRAFAKGNLGDMLGAIQDYNRGIVLDPHDAKAFSNRGNTKYAIGDMQGAILDFNKAIELNPQLAGTLYNRGLVKSAIGDNKGACLDWNKAGELGIKQAYEMIRNYCK